MKKVFHFLLISLLSATHFRCDETTDFLKNLNEAPQINFMNNPDQPVWSDSIKMGVKTSQERYPITLRVTDKNHNLVEVVYTQLSGTGTLKQGGVEIISNNIEFARDSAVLDFDYYPENYGIHRLGLRAKDNFGLTSSVSVEITAFENLAPVAVVRWTKRGLRDKYHYELRANESYDRDARFGGRVEEYEYKILGVIRRVLATTDDAAYHQVIFPQKGIYPYEVRVRDNDGKWSEPRVGEVVVD